MIERKIYKITCPDCNGSGLTTLDGTFKEHECACKNGIRNVIVEFDIHDDFKDITNQEDWLTKVSNKEISLKNE